VPTQIRWRTPVPLSPAEQAVAQKLKRTGKFYVVPPEVRAESFDEAFQARPVVRPTRTARGQRLSACPGNGLPTIVFLITLRVGYPVCRTSARAVRMYQGR
jgi:hypothetical protein